MNVRTQRSKVATLLLLFLSLPLLFIGALGSAGSAAASAIPGAITEIKTTATHVSRWDRVDFDCVWAVPDGSAAKDTFTMQLPEQLKWWGTTDFDLNNAAGDVVATAHADSSGLVTFTLSDFVTDHPNDVGGTCEFTTQYTAAQTAPGEETLVFPVGDQIIRVPVIDNGPCVEPCAAQNPTKAAKYMWWTDSSQSRLQSVLLTPALTEDVNTVTITDTPGPGHALDCSSVVPAVGKTLLPDGSVGEPSDTALYPADITCTESGLTAIWTGLPAGEYVRLGVQSTLTDTTLMMYTNNGVVTLNGQGFPVQDQADIKSAGGTGDGTTPSPTPTTAVPTTAVPTVVPTVAPTTAAPTMVPTESTVPVPETSSPPAAIGTVPAGTDALAFTGAVNNHVLLAAGSVLLMGAVAIFLAKGRRRQH